MEIVKIANKLHACLWENPNRAYTFQLRWSSKHISHKTPAKSCMPGCISETHSDQKVIYLPTSIYSSAITRQMIEAYMRLMGQNSTVAFSFYKYEYVMWPQIPSCIQNNTYLKKITFWFVYIIILTKSHMSFHTLHCFGCISEMHSGNNNNDNNNNLFVYIYIFSGHNNANYGSPYGTLLNW